MWAQKLGNAGGEYSSFKHTIYSGFVIITYIHKAQSDLKSFASESQYIEVT